MLFKFSVTLLPHLSRISTAFNNNFVPTLWFLFTHTQNLSHHACALPQVDQQTLQPLFSLDLDIVYNSNITRISLSERSDLDKDKFN